MPHVLLDNRKHKKTSLMSRICLQDTQDESKIQQILCCETISDEKRKYVTKTEVDELDEYFKHNVKDNLSLKIYCLYLIYYTISHIDIKIICK